MGSFRSRHPENTNLSDVADADASASLKLTPTQSEIEPALSRLSEHAECFLFSYSPKLRSLVSWSPNASEIFGAPLNSLMREGNLFLRHVHPDDRFRVLAALERSLAEQSPYQISYRWIRPDRDELRWLHCRARVSTHPGNLKSEPLLLSGMILDLGGALRSERISTENAATLNQDALEVLPSFYFMLDRDLRVALVTHSSAPITRETPQSVPLVSTEQMDFGDPQFSASHFQLGRSILEAFGTETLRAQYSRVFEQLLSGALPFHHTRLSHLEPPLMLELYPCKQNTEIVGIIGIAHDCSKIAGLERQVAELRRAEGLRSLASGVSHHVNNVLQGILGQATLIEAHASDQESVIREARGITELVQRASDLVQQLFAFDESAQGSLSPIDLNLTVMAAVSAVEDLFATPLEIQVSFGNPLPVLARQQTLVEVFQDLLRIARDHVTKGGSTADAQALAATPPKIESALSIRTVHSEITSTELSRTRPGTYSQLLITEIRRSSSPGENPLKRMRSLHSVTTSSTFRKAQSTIERFGGVLSAQLSAQGEFSLSLLLPSLTSEEPAVFVIDRAATPEVLLVDDDPTVLKTVEIMLHDMGYRCIAAQSGARAIQLARSYRRSLKLALLDAVLPGQDEQKLLRALKEEIPELIVIGFTGASAEKGNALRAAGAARVLKKPVEPALLKEVLRSFIRPEGSSVANG